MAEDRTITYPADAMQRIADRLCDIDYNLPGDEARDYALDIVLEVTAAVDKLRASEKVIDIDMVERGARALARRAGDEGMFDVIRSSTVEIVEGYREDAGAVLRAALEVNDA